MELVVVLAIIAILAAISIPVVGHMKTRAKAAAQRQQLAGLSQALGAYYADFHVYPPSDNPTNPTASMYPGNVIAPGRGPATLAQGLMGYLPAALDGAGSGIAGDPTYGFRIKGSGVGATGKIYGPYGPDDNKYFADNNPAPAANPDTDRAFIDVYGSEIFYFRSTRAVTDRTGLPPVTRVFGTTGSGNNYYFEAPDNQYKFGQTAYTNTWNETLVPPDQTPPNHSTSDYAAFFKLLGASSNDITTSSAAITGANSYLLMSLGPDGLPYTGDDIILSTP
ncbi:MAG TPA: hypothetical protein VHQ47_05260 [Phycisphaerae bacterium]|nr:hypothetical protein [Phycisphaerae bacterium]